MCATGRVRGAPRAAQDGGLDTVEANEELGLPVDARSYGMSAQILRDLDVRRLRLITNNPTKASKRPTHNAPPHTTRAHTQTKFQTHATKGRGLAQQEVAERDEKEEEEKASPSAAVSCPPASSKRNARETEGSRNPTATPRHTAQRTPPPPFLDGQMLDRTLDVPAAMTTT